MSSSAAHSHTSLFSQKHYTGTAFYHGKLDTSNCFEFFVTTQIKIHASRHVDPHTKKSYIHKTKKLFSKSSKFRPMSDGDGTSESKECQPQVPMAWSKEIDSCRDDLCNVVELLFNRTANCSWYSPDDSRRRQAMKSCVRGWHLFLIRVNGMRSFM